MGGVDPITLAAISATVGGASAKLVDKAWDAGERWLTGYYEDHEQKALERAKANSLDFLADLAHRVGRLEEEAEDDESTKRQIESALEDPDFSALLKDAVFASARTTNKDKHSLLARIVAERLRAKADDLLALSSTMACEAVKNLTPRQIHLLGLSAIVYWVRPWTVFPPEGISPEVFGSWYAAWLERDVSAHLPLEPPTAIELLHLQATGCVNYLPTSSRDMREFIGPKADSGYNWPYDEFVDGAVGRQLHQIWDAGLFRILPTSVGQLLGVYVTDEATGDRTIINW